MMDRMKPNSNEKALRKQFNKGMIIGFALGFTGCLTGSFISGVLERYEQLQDEKQAITMHQKPQLEILGHR